MQLNCYGVGTVTSDPEIRKLGEKNTSFCSVNLAFNRSFKSGDGFKEEVCFVQAKFWGNQADKFAEKAKKGTLVFIEGFMVQENWEDKQGVKHTTLTIKPSTFQICERNGAINKVASATYQKTVLQQVATQAAPPKNVKVAVQPVKAKTKPQPQPQPEPEDDDTEAVAVIETSDDEIPF